MERCYNKTHARKHGIPMLCQNSINLTCQNFCSYDKYLIQVKVKVSLCVPLRHNWGGEEVQHCTFLTLSQGGSEQFALILGKVPLVLAEQDTDWYRDLIWPGRLLKEKTLLPVPEIELYSFSFIQPIASVSILTTQLLQNLWWAGKKMFEIQILVPKFQRSCSVKFNQVSKSKIFS